MTNTETKIPPLTLAVSHLQHPPPPLELPLIKDVMFPFPFRNLFTDAIAIGWTIVEL